MVPELLDGTGHIAWFKAGETIFEPSGINYLGIPGLINAHNIIATLIVQVRIGPSPAWQAGLEREENLVVVGSDVHGSA